MIKIIQEPGDNDGLEIEVEGDLFIDAERLTFGELPEYTISIKSYAYTATVLPGRKTRLRELLTKEWTTSTDEDREDLIAGILGAL